MSISFSALRQAVQSGYRYRFLCLDVGTSKIGVSISGGVNYNAEPLAVLVRHKSLYASEERLGGRFVQVAQAVHRMVKQHQISAIVIGTPLNRFGQDTAQSREIKKFTQALMERSWIVPMPPPTKIVLPPLGELVDYVYWNEFGSTKAAVEELHSLGKKRARAHAPHIDAYAAEEILNSFLKALRGGRRRVDDEF
jgi:RNase H-fold protein (predicted Holliday junction resolvase)